MKLWCALSLAVMIASSPANAEQVTIHGMGIRSCGEWTIEHRKGDWEAIVQDSWLAGFLSGYNVYSLQIVDIGETTDFSGKVQWMNQYCEANPLDTIAEAAMLLIIELYERSQQQRR